MKIERATLGTVMAALLFMPLMPADGQSVGNMLVTDVRNTVGDIWAVWTSPFHADSKDWLLAAGAIGASAAVSPLDAGVDRWAVRNRDDDALKFLQPVREGGIAFSGKTITPVAVGALAVGLIAKNERLQEGLFGCLSAYASTSAVRTFVVYPLVARTRPDSSRSGPSASPASNGDQYHFSFPGTRDWGRHATPGGHFANVSACASFLTNRFDMGLMEPVVWTVTTAVGVGRILDRRHWLSDQVLGGLFGYAAGRAVAIRSSHRANQTKGTSNHGDDYDDSFVSNLFFEPSATGVGVNVGWRRVF